MNISGYQVYSTLVFSTFPCQNPIVVSVRYLKFHRANDITIQDTWLGNTRPTACCSDYHLENTLPPAS